MPRESIGQCGCAQYPDKRWIEAELELAICYIRHACGEPSPGYQLEVLWHEHELGEYASVGITWDGSCGAPWDYISRADDALLRFDQAVAWSDLAQDLKDSANKDKEVAIADDDEEDDGPEQWEVGEEIVSRGLPQRIELYRRGDMVEISLRDWEVAVAIFQKEGWSAVRPLETYICPLGFITQDEGKAMQRAGRSLLTKIDAELALCVSVPMDLGLLYRLIGFVGGGAFIVGRQGAFADATANDFPDSGN